MEISKLVRDNVRKLEPYSSARDEFWGMDYVLLDANENPFDSEINRYPDPYQRELKKKIAQIKSIPSKNIFIGNGSDEIIDLLFRCFCEPYQDTVSSISPSYGMYKVSASINCVDIHYTSLDPGFLLNAGNLLKATRSTDKMIFLCSPNNPSGNALDPDEIKKVLEEFKGIVVVDEAYGDFSEHDSMIAYLGEYPNLIVLQTLSKAWGAAGLRLGMGFMNDEIIRYLNKIKPPYNVNVLSQNTAMQLLDSYDLFRERLGEITEQREYLTQALNKCSAIVNVYDSDANFLLVKFIDPQRAYQKLKKAGIIVRDRTKTHMCEGCLRLTIGKRDENEKMIEILNNL